MATCKFKNIQVCRMILNDNFAILSANIFSIHYVKMI